MKSTQLLCVVDDSTDYLYVLQKLFTRSFPQYSIQLFSSGDDFLQKLPQMVQRPSLIILDRHMPNIDGHQLLVSLKEDFTYHDIPVVMMSADASNEEIEGCYKAGANSFLRKPDDFTLLETSLKVICQYWIGLNLMPLELSRSVENS